mmetsp:Transcript_41569/g.97533  ORF Transcript_41569/g.97533 Transcript_41569/m.97533 type:complete len:243 (+) Transcript_41569:881-1609(+)
MTRIISRTACQGRQQQRQPPRVRHPLLRLNPLCTSLLSRSVSIPSQRQWQVLKNLQRQRHPPQPRQRQEQLHHSKRSRESCQLLPKSVQPQRPQPLGPPQLRQPQGQLHHSGWLKEDCQLKSLHQRQRTPQQQLQQLLRGPLQPLGPQPRRGSSRESRQQPLRRHQRRRLQRQPHRGPPSFPRSPLVAMSPPSASWATGVTCALRRRSKRTPHGSAASGDTSGYRWGGSCILCFGASSLRLL